MRRFCVFWVIFIFFNLKLFSAVNLIAPINNNRCQDNQVDFFWESYPGAILYNLKVSLYSDLSNPVFDTNVTTTSVSKLLSGSNAQYYWRVFAVLSFTPPQFDSSAIWSFTTKPSPPLPSRPTSNSSCNPIVVTFTWGPINNVLNYRLQISNTNLFLTLIKDTIVTSNSVSVRLPNWDTKYYWRVLANTNYGCSTNFSSPDSFKTNREPPTLIQPRDSIHSVWGQLTFTWNVPTNASSYNLQISTQPDFSVILYDEVTAAKTLTKVLTDYNTRFYWRVKAVYPDCETEFSSIRTFRTAYAPPHNLYPPKDTFCHSNTVLFKWDAVNGATTYRLQVSQSDSLDLNLIVLDTLINTRQFTYYFDKSLQKYSWRVRAEDKQNVGLWSDTMRFQTTYAPPKHLNPMNGDETNITVKFVWTKDVPGSTFELQVSDTNNFNLIQRRIFDFSGLITDTIVLKLPHFNRKYWWRVRASDAYCRSDWSTPTYFRTKLQKPILTFPPNNSTKMPLKVTFEWTKPEGWESFEIHISKDAQFTSLFAGRTGIATNSVTIADFDQSTQYFWRVRAINKEDTSRWSDVFKFTTGPNPLEIPNLIYPTNNGENLPTNVSFTWSSVPRAKYYQLQIAEDLQFTQKILEYLNISDTTYLVSDLKPMSEYFWRVLAYNDSTTSNWSPIWRFRTQPPIPKGPVFLSIPPNETKGVDVSLSLIWSPVQYAEMYHLQVAKDENFVAQSLVLNDSNLIMPQKYLTGLEYNTKYFWHVRAYNSAGSTSWSDTWWFQTMVSSVGEENNVFLLSFNPNENNLTLTFQEGFLEAINIRLFDLFGRVVFSSQLLEDRNSITIPCDKLSKGVYFLHIISKEKSFVARITI